MQLSSICHPQHSSYQFGSSLLLCSHRPYQLRQRGCSSLHDTMGCPPLPASYGRVSTCCDHHGMHLMAKANAPRQAQHSRVVQTPPADHGADRTGCSPRAPFPIPLLPGLQVPARHNGLFMISAPWHGIRAHASPWSATDRPSRGAKLHGSACCPTSLPRSHQRCNNAPWAAGYPAFQFNATALSRQHAAFTKAGQDS